MIDAVPRVHPRPPYRPIYSRRQGHSLNRRRGDEKRCERPVHSRSAASYRKGKTPPAAMETLVFSKPGYRYLEYERLVLNPGVNGLDILLERGPAQ